MYAADDVTAELEHLYGLRNKAEVIVGTDAGVWGCCSETPKAGNGFP